MLGRKPSAVQRDDKLSPKRHSRNPFFPLSTTCSLEECRSSLHISLHDVASHLQKSIFPPIVGIRYLLRTYLDAFACPCHSINANLRDLLMTVHSGAAATAVIVKGILKFN